jgi:Transmembrane secretion effector
MDAEKQATFAAPAVPNFRRYVSGQSLSLIGTWVETVAQALLVLRSTRSGAVLGLTTAARYAPILLLSPYAGLLVDRHSKRFIHISTARLSTFMQEAEQRLYSIPPQTYAQVIFLAD